MITRPQLRGAIRLSRGVLWPSADFVGTHRVLRTASLGMARSADAAKAALEGLRRASLTKTSGDRP
jgi:hypothetical protein